MAWLRSLPLFVNLLGGAVLSLYLPMAFAIQLRDWDIARTFFYYGTFLLILLALVAIAVAGRTSANTARHYLLTIFAALITIPAVLALPFDYLVPQINFRQAYFEMLSCLTTTGATLFDDPAALPAPLHLMRAVTGWLGGFSILVVALSIFQPLHIGGFEVLPRSHGARARQIRVSDANQRLIRFSRQVLPIYVGVTAALAIALMVSGDRALVAVSHAMSILSTSGISPVGGLSGAASGYLGEVLLFLFMVFAITRHAFLSDAEGQAVRGMKTDKEANIALICITVIPVILFLRHWTGALEVSADWSWGDALGALWGAMFTVASFLTTTGFESEAWDGARDWSALGTPGILLMALAMMGGGIATTAGGVKLLRIYALFKHGQREIDRLSHPSSVGGRGGRARVLRQQGAVVAWVFLMLFLLSLSITAMALAASGLNFEEAWVFAAAAISTTGPLVEFASDSPTTYADLPDISRMILCLAMVLGRLEALAVVSLLNPNFWR